MNKVDGVVDFMGHTSGERAQRRHFFGLDQLLLGVDNFAVLLFQLHRAFVDFVFEVTVDVEELEVSRDPGQQFLFADRLGQKVVGADFKAVHHVADLGFGGEEDHRQVGCGVLLAQFFTHFKAGHFWHHDVQQDQVERAMLRHSIERRRAVIGFEQGVVVHRQVIEQYLAVDWFVVDQ